MLVITHHFDPPAALGSGPQTVHNCSAALRCSPTRSVLGRGVPAPGKWMDLGVENAGKYDGFTDKIKVYHAKDTY